MEIRTAVRIIPSSVRWFRIAVCQLFSCGLADDISSCASGARQHILGITEEGEAVGVEKGEGCVKVSHWLAPGQMEVYRVAPAK